MEVGSKLRIVDYNSLAYWFISPRNLSHNHDLTQGAVLSDRETFRNLKLTVS